MAIHEEELVRVVADLQRLVGQPVQGVWQPARDRVVIGIGDELLLLVPRGPHARLHTVRDRPKNPQRPFSFQGACRSRLVGALTALTKTPGDRVVDLQFGGNHLHLRLTGRSGGLWLLEGDRVVAAFDGPALAALPATSPQPPRSDPPRFTPREGETWDRAAARFFTAEEARQRVQDRRADLERGLRRALARDLRLADGLRDDLDKASEAPRLRRMADALAANLHRVPRGADAFPVMDLEDPDLQHVVPLDPGKPASNSLERLYSKARRLDRVGDRVLLHLDEVEKRVAALQDALARLPAVEDAGLADLERLVPPERARRTPEGGPDRPWTTWTGPRGERVLVGRNEKGNRRLSFQVARGSDYWMHVRERPGAHLIIVMDGRDSPPLDLLLAAAQICLIAAKVPEGSAADVQYTRCRNIRAIPGEGARVIVHDEKVLRVTREPAALAAWSHD
jgi:predicted ribosome quality control (RQC) complex YloA/Tae2 family protein